MATEVSTMQVATRVEATTEVSPDQPPVGEDPEWNKQLAKDWKAMAEKVQELAKLSKGPGYNKDIQPEQVMANLERVQKKTKKDEDSTWSKVKTSVSKTLTVISTVGGIAADAASQVFAPAGQCYNAINFVISAWQGYLEAFQVLNGLFEDCFAFLNRLPDYVKGNMNANMSGVASQVLQLFVNICERALRLRTSRSSKFALFMKVAFLSDDDFSDFRAELDKLTRWEELNAIARIYNTSAIAADSATKAVDILTNDRAEQQLKEQEQLDTRHLMRTLAFDETPATWNSAAQAPIATWSQINRRIHNRLVERTGDWLFQDDLFTTWAKNKGEQPLLALVGEEGAGKSYLISAAISHLRKAGSQPGLDKEDKSRRLVAYHYIDNQKPNAGIHCLGKSIIWQFAASDASYKQSIAATCRDAAYIDPKEILPRLLLNNRKELEHIDAVFYVLINKVGSRNHNVDESLVKFLHAVSHFKNSAVRVLFSTTAGTIERLKARDISCPTILISEKNESDRKKYIGSRMDRMHALANIRQREVRSIREEIENSLCEHSKGNYDLISATLDKIHNLENEEDIRGSLNCAERSISQHIRDDIKVLNDIRTGKELAEINEIVLWLNFAKERISPEMMTAVLQAKNKSASLLPLEDRIKNKFILFEINEDGYVDFRAGNVPGKIPQRRDLAQKRLNDSQALNQGEADIVNHFLRNVCPSHLLDKIDLDSHLKQKMKVREEQICQEDNLTSHFLIAQTCVDVLANDDDDRLAVLREYAVAHFAQHMLETKRESIPPDSLAEFGSNLMKLFHDPDAIDNLLWASSPAPQLPDLLRDEKFRGEISRWLEDPIVVSKIDANESKRWWKIDKNNTPSALKEPSIRQMAVHCFQRESPPDVSITAFKGIQSFCHQMMQCPKAVAESRSPSPDEIEKWCLERLEAKQGALKQDARWHTQMAIILRAHEEFAKAEERCKQALKIDKKYWRASLLQAKLVKSPKEAIDTLKKLTKRFEEDEKLQREHQKAFADISYNLGARYWAESKIRDAVDSYSESIRRDPSASEHVFRIISAYKNKGKWPDIIDLIDLIDDLGRDHLTAMVVAMSETQDFHTIILRALKETGYLRREILDVVYENAISITKDRDHATSFFLRHYYASALSALHPAPTDQVRNVLEDAVRDLQYTSFDLPRAFFLVGYRLGTIYLGEAQKAKADKNKDADKKKEAAQKALQKMVDILPEQLNEDQMRLPLSLFAARYHLTNNDEESAHAAAHNTLKMAVELLSDNDASNDILAYWKILYAVIPFEDKKNVTAALAMMKRQSDFEMKCSCGCGHTWATPGDMWWCKDCINVVLNGPCKETVKNPDSPNHVCHKSHSHFHIPHWDEKVMEVPKDKIPYKGDAITMEQWRDKLIDKYHLGKSGKLHVLRH